MGQAAVEALLDGQRNIMIGLVDNEEIVHVPFSQAIRDDKPIDRDLLNTVKILSI